MNESTPPNAAAPQGSTDAHLEREAARLEALMAAGRLSEGQDAVSHLLSSHPSWGLGWKISAAFLTVMGRRAEAFEAVRMAVSCLPDDAELYNIVGTLHRDSGDLDRAVAAYSRAIELQPEFPEVYNNLGGAHMLQGDPDQAIAAFLTAVSQNPDYPEALHNLGNALLAKGSAAEAIPAFLRATGLRPTMLQSLSMACHLMLQCALWKDIPPATRHLIDNLGRPGYQAPIPFVFSMLPGVSRQHQRTCARLFAEQQYGGFLSQPPIHHAAIGRRQKLRIGYLSADFSDHATCHLLTGVLEAHDRSAFVIHAYSYGADDASEARRRVEAACDAFSDIRASSHEEAARLIASDAMDILIDLKGFTENARPQIVALRPAPVVVSWLGYPGTLGCARLADYIIGDRIVTPLEHQPDYSEALALMPHCYQPNDRAREVGPRPARKDAGLPEDAVILCSFNQSYKITPETLDAWCRILAAVPNAVLWLLACNQASVENLGREARARGISPRRVIFAPRLAAPQHLGRLQLADLALDTFPCTSHTTGSDALWVGVPMVTRIGDTFVSRVAASLLSAAGLPQLVTDTWDGYCELATALALDKSRLEALKRHLVDTRPSSVLFDTARFAQDLEALLHRIWQQKLAGVVAGIE